MAEKSKILPAGIVWQLDGMKRSRPAAKVANYYPGVGALSYTAGGEGFYLNARTVVA